MTSSRHASATPLSGEWPKVRLDSVALVDRNTIAAEDIDDTDLYVGLGNVTVDGELLAVSYAHEADIRSSKFAFTADHLLYGKLRPYLSKIAAPDFAGVCSTDIVPIRPGAELDRRYLLHYLRTPAMVAHAASKAVGINLPRLSPRQLESFEIPLPPMEEQRRIAAALDAAETLRAKRRRALGVLGTLRTSVVLECVADLNGREPLADHLEFVTSGSRGWAKYYSKSGSRFIRSQDVLLGEFDDVTPAYVRPPVDSESKQTRISKDDLLITITGVVGKVAAAPAALDGAFISQHVAIARLSDTLRPGFVEAYLCSEEGQRQLERVQYGQTKPGLNLSQIRELRVPVPPDALQAALLSNLEQLAAHRAVSQDAVAKTDTLLASLQQRASRGEL